MLMLNEFERNVDKCTEDNNQYDETTSRLLRITKGMTKEQLGSRRVLCEWVRRSMASSDTVNGVGRKKVVAAKDMNDRDRGIYRYIINKCPTDDAILRIKTLIDNGPIIRGKRVSGRTIDTLVTRFQMYRNVRYYIEIDKTGGRHIVATPTDMSNVILFDISNSYDQKMRMCSKTYFDCFGRGDEVEHQLASGGVVNISLCQFNFFIWAEEFCVFDYLAQELDTIINVKRQTQVHIYKPKCNTKSRKRKRYDAVQVDKSTHIMIAPTLRPPTTHRSPGVQLVGRRSPVNLAALQRKKKRVRTKSTPKSTPKRPHHVKRKPRKKKAHTQTSKRSLDTPEHRANWLEQAKTNIDIHLKIQRQWCENL